MDDLLKLYDIIAEKKFDGFISPWKGVKKVSVLLKCSSLAAALIGLVFIYGCTTSSTGGAHDSKNNETLVQYSFDCGNLSCFYTSNVIDFTSSDHQARTCIWNCGTGFNQSIRAQVTLKFEKVNGCWQLTHEELSANYSGTCS